jgi:limonene-1,2-epoxide hydrolase
MCLFAATAAQRLDVSMAAKQEAAVRAFIAELEGYELDSAQIARVLSRIAADARYQVFAWEDPLVGHDAIRAELLQMAPRYRDLRSEIVMIGSVGSTVFVERLDSMIINDKQVTWHVAAVYEVDAEGKIAAWRDYVDSREIAAQVGGDVSTAGER